MKKMISILLLCVILSISALSFAEQYPREAVFDDFTVAFDSVKKDGGNFIIRLSAYFASEADATRLNITMRPQDTLGEEPRYLSPEEITSFFECANRIYSAMDGGFRHMTAEEMDKVYVSPCHSNLLVKFKTSLGEDFIPNGSYDRYDFGMFDVPEKQRDGRWRRTVLFKATGFSTKEEGVVLEFSLFDPHDDTPYTGEVEQTIYISFYR